MKQIPLTQGKYAIIDDEDYEYLSQFKWRVNAYGYAIREQYLGVENGKRKRINIFMHRLIVETPEGKETDHINGERNDNRRCNLRVCTRYENQRNTKKQPNCTSKYKGVSLHKRDKIWQAQIRTDGKVKYLGSFRSEDDARNAYDEAAIYHFGEYAKPNFEKVA